ncbi:hypothetical protein AX15_005611 [Amanita polypyramis BW_CC]|nr:hypothetical protein AX15_005611 [Amanita polypyramis BW_CC]
MTRSKAVPTAGTTTTVREPVFTRPPPAATKGKSIPPESVPPVETVKTRRGALLEVTKLVTNNDSKRKTSATLKGKEKETIAALEKAKPVLTNVRRPLQETATTRTATRRITRSTAAAVPTTTTTTTKQPSRLAKKTVVPEVCTEPAIPEESEPEPVIAKVKEPQTAFIPPPSSIRKRSSNLAEQTEEPPRVTKRLHTEKEKTERKDQDDSQEEADKVAIGLILHDVDPESPSKSQQWSDLDADDWEDPAMASEYVVEICKYWKRIEIATLPDPDYLAHQPHITWEHRGLLINWLMETHIRFRFLHETLFLCINILDRILSRRVISLQKLQLVGIACLLIASKYEETCSPSVAEMVLLCEGAYRVEEIIRAEQYILKAINWDLSFPGPMGWLRRGSKADEYEEKARTIAKYFMEIGCLERHLIGSPSSLIATASLWLARLIVGREEWTPNLVHYTTYEEHELIPIANHILNHILQPTIFPVVYKKYAGKKFLKCSVYLKNWTRQRWPEGTQVELGKHLEWLKADVRVMKERLATEAARDLQRLGLGTQAKPTVTEPRRNIFTNL